MTVTRTADNYPELLEMLHRVSAATHCDSYFKRPAIIECFIDRCNQEMPKGWRAEPWTANRSVSIFLWGEFRWSFLYEDIEEDIVRFLDLNNSFVREALAHG